MIQDSALKRDPAGNPRSLRNEPKGFLQSRHVGPFVEPEDVSVQWEKAYLPHTLAFARVQYSLVLAAASIRSSESNSSFCLCVLRKPHVLI